MLVRLVVVVMLVAVVVMVVVMMIIVVMMVIVGEFHVWVGTGLVMATRGGRARVGEPQKRGSIGNGIKQFAK